MREELRLLNAVIGMAQGAGSWPAPLRALGFQLTALQRDVGLNLEGRQQIVTPEAVLQSMDVDGCLVVESKSSSFSAVQARKYWNLRATDLVNYGSCNEPPNVESHVVAPVYFCSRMHSSELVSRIDDFNINEPACLPLVDYDNHRFELRTGGIRLVQVNTLFEAGVHFEETDWPTRFVPFDLVSPLGEIVGSVLIELVSLMFHPDISDFSSVDIAQGHPDTGSDGCVSYFTKMGRQTQRGYRIKIAEVVELFRRSYVSDYLERSAPGPRWRKLRPISTGTQMSSLQSRATEFCSRVREGLPLPQVPQTPPLIGQAELEELVADEG